jgi:hypothetical protein
MGSSLTSHDYLVLTALHGALCHLPRLQGTRMPHAMTVTKLSSLGVPGRLVSEQNSALSCAWNVVMKALFVPVATEELFGPFFTHRLFCNYRANQAYPCDLLTKTMPEGFCSWPVCSA